MDASGQLVALARAALGRALAAHDLEVARDAVDALLHPAAVGFQLRFAFAAAHADAALLPRQVAPEPRQARQQMLQLRQFDLQLAFARAGALREDVENERRAVEHLAVENLFQVAALRGRKFVVEDDGVDVVPGGSSCGEFLGLAFADVGGGAGRLQLLNAVADDFAAGGGGQFGKFLQRIAQTPTPCRDLSSTPTRKTRSVLAVPGLDQCFQLLCLYRSFRPPGLTIALSWAGEKAVL